MRSGSNLVNIAHAGSVIVDRAGTEATLTQTLHALARLRGGLAPRSVSDYYDVPQDIDAFRTALARRIDAFVKSRTEQGESGAGQPADGVAQPASHGV